MAYDGRLDKQLFVKSWEAQGSTILVGVYSYNNGPKKVQISRELKAEDGKPGFAKLGRLTKEELQGVLPLLQEAMAHLD